jgi:hypothetical protein
MGTRTYTTLFDTSFVDKHMKELYEALETSYLERKKYMTGASQRACEARLAALRGIWTLLLDRTQD